MQNDAICGTFYYNLKEKLCFIAMKLFDSYITTPLL